MKTKDFIESGYGITGLLQIIPPALGFAYGLNDTLSVCIKAMQDAKGLGKNTELATVTQMLFTFAFE